MNISILHLCIFSLAGLSCTAKAPPAPQSPEAPAKEAVAAAAGGGAQGEATAVFAQRCTMCHGEHGRGDGPAAANLNPRPRNYTDPAWQAKTSDAHIAKIIIEGGPAVGMSVLMPPNPDLRDKPQVVAELVQVVRQLGKAP